MLGEVALELVNLFAFGDHPPVQYPFEFGHKHVLWRHANFDQRDHLLFSVCDLIF